jgi:hypothetical protein
MAARSRKKVSGHDEQVQYLKDKIGDTSKLASSLKLGINDIALKLENMMEAMEGLGKNFKDISTGESEKNISAKETFGKLAGSINRVGEKQAHQIGKLKGLTGQLDAFEGKCKNAKSALDEYEKQAKNLAAKTTAAASAKGGSKEKAMKEKELEGSQQQEHGAARDLAKVMQDFENGRVEMFKDVLGDFIHIHIGEHELSSLPVARAASHRAVTPLGARITQLSDRARAVVLHQTTMPRHWSASRRCIASTIRFISTRPPARCRDVDMPHRSYRGWRRADPPRQYRGNRRPAEEPPRH